MSLYKINGVELEIDLGDADFQAKYEEAFDKMAIEEKEVQKVGKMSALTISYCEMFNHLFDDIFGEGTSQKLFKGKHNLALTDKTYEEFIDICKKQKDELQANRNRLTNKYRPNREQRRKR